MRCLLGFVLVGVALGNVNRVRAEADAPAAATRSLVQKIQIEPLGDAQVQMVWQMTPAGYRQFQTLLATPDGKFLRPPTPENAINFLDLNNLWIKAESPKGAFDDDRHRFTVNFRLKGYAKSAPNNFWVIDLLDDGRWHEPLMAAGRIRYSLPPRAGMYNYHLAKYQTDSGLAVLETKGGYFLERIEVTLPAGSKEVAVGKLGNGRHALRYQTPKPAPATSDSDPSAGLRVLLQTRQEIVPVLHKLYADPRWSTLYVGRLRIENHSADTLTDVRVRYRCTIPGCQKDVSESEPIAATLYPGMSVSHAIYPILDPNICKLRSKTTGEWAVEYSYTDPEGKRKLGTRKAQLTILGVNDAPSTSLDLTGSPARDVTYEHLAHDMPILIASFVHPDDPVVKDLKGQVSKVVGGAVTGSEPEQYLEALYNVFRMNIAYTTPSGGQRDDGRFFQHLYYARDVLRTRSGTCIDLAILFASVAEASGMDACVVMIPGHAFPAVVLKTKNKEGKIEDVLYPVETTGCAGGQWNKSAAFSEAVSGARKTYAEAVKKGHYAVIRMKDLRAWGVSPPELPDLPANPLESWKVVMPPTKPFARFKVQHEKNVTVKDKKGARFTIDYEIQDAKHQPCSVQFYVLDKDNKMVKDKAGRFLGVAETIKLDSDRPGIKTAVLFFPYERMTELLAEGETKEYKFMVNIYSPVFQDFVTEKPWSTIFKIGR